MRVVFLRSNPVAPDPRVEKQAQTLVDRGYKVMIVGWDRYGIAPEKEDTYYGKIQRIRIPAKFGQGINNLGAMLKWQMALLKWLLKNKYDVIHCCDFDTVMAGFLVGKIKGVKIVYDIFDFYAEMLNNTSNIIKKIIKKIDFFIINHVDAVILADESRLKQITGTNPKLLEVIYNSPTDTYNDCSNLQHSDFKIVYVGILQKDRGLFEAIEVVKKHPEWTMDIAGFGADEDIVKSLISGCPNIKFHGRINYQEAISLSSLADVLFATYDPSIPNNKYASPNKLFEAMMLGKPIIVSDGTSMAEIVKYENNGIVVEYGDDNLLEQALISLWTDKKTKYIMGKNSRDAYIREYQWAKMEIRLLQVYSLLKS